MSIHVEWANATHLDAEMAAPGSFADSYATVNDQPVLLLGSDSIFAIEGTVEEIRAALAQALQEVDRYAREESA